MSADITPERQRQITELLGKVISDPDPERTVIACDDCRTPVLATTDRLLVVDHDPTCPTFQSMSPAELIETDEDDDLIVVHVAGPTASTNDDRE